MEARSNTLSRLAALGAVGLAAAALAACGSGDSDTGRPEASRSGEVKPKEKAPASAGDKVEGAPDEGISNRPGGPGGKAGE